jgi:hypothetical protein
VALVVTLLIAAGGLVFWLQLRPEIPSQTLGSSPSTHDHPAATTTATTATPTAPTVTAPPPPTNTVAAAPSATTTTTTTPTAEPTAISLSALPTVTGPTGHDPIVRGKGKLPRKGAKTASTAAATAPETPPPATPDPPPPPEPKVPDDMPNPYR